MKNTIEKQYSLYFEVEEKYGMSKFGIGSNATWNLDSSRLVFVLSRYKFVSRMFYGFNNVLEIGCGDGFASKIVADSVHNLVLSDIDPLLITEAKKITKNKNVKFKIYDFTRDKSISKFKGIYALDVFEHIPKQKEKSFLRNIVLSLTKDGVLILGMPSIESQVYASDASAVGHVNCKSKFEFQKTLSNYFQNVFMFSMNDEVLHTGFYGMSHYLIAICTNPISKNKS